MKQTRITDNITYLEPDSMVLLQTCAGLIIDGQRKIFLDVGMGARENTALLQKEAPDLAVISHYHFDHSTWLTQVRECSAATIYVPEAEVQYLTSLEYAIAKTGGGLGQTGYWTDQVVSAGYRTVDSPLSYGEDFSIFSDASLRIEPILTPGHSPGHSCFYFPQEKILFCGDMGADRFGPWYGWCDCNLQAYVTSLLKLMTLDVKLLLSSHGGLIADGINEIWTRCIAQIAARERKVEIGLNGGMSKAQIVAQGLFYPASVHVDGPQYTMINMCESAIFDQHRDLLEAGGLKAQFPELQFV